MFLQCRKSTAICRVQPFSTQVQMGREFDAQHGVFCLADVDLLIFQVYCTMFIDLILSGLVYIDKLSVLFMNVSVLLCCDVDLRP